MNLDEIIEDIGKNLKSALHLTDIEYHIQNFEINDLKETYFRFKLPKNTSEQTSFKTYKKLGDIVRLNNPFVSIDYSYSVTHDDGKRKISIRIGEDIKNPDEKLETLKKAAESFNYVLKRIVKYGAKK